MTEVRFSALGDVCAITTGGTPARTRRDFFGGGIPWVKIGDMVDGIVRTTEETISQAGIKGSSAKLFPRGTVLVSIFATIGRTAILEVDAATNQAIAGITPYDSLDSAYLRYFLDSKHGELNALARGVAQPNINQKILKSLQIPLPPLAEQRRIVDLLSRAEGIVRLRREAQRKAAELIPAIFLDLFGDPATNPKNWSMTAFRDMLRVSSGAFLPAKKMDSSGTYPVYGGNGLSGRHSEYMFDDQKIVIGRVGEHCGNVHLTEPNCWITDNALYIREVSRALEIKFLLWHLRMMHLNQYASRAGQPLISAGRLADTQLLLPPVDLQHQFAAKAEAVHSIATRQTAALATAQATFDALLHRAFVV